MPLALSLILRLRPPALGDGQSGIVVPGGFVILTRPDGTILTRPDGTILTKAAA